MKLSKIRNILGSLLGISCLAVSQAAVRQVTYAQRLVDLAALQNPDLPVIAFHVTAPGATNNTIVAANVPKLLGLKSDPADLAVLSSDKPAFASAPGKGTCEVLLPLRDVNDNTIGVLAVVSKLKASRHFEEDCTARAVRIRDQLKLVIPSHDDLFDQYDLTTEAGATFGQRLIVATAVRHPEILVLAMHLKAPGEALYKIWATNRPVVMYSAEPGETDPNIAERGHVALTLFSQTHRLVAELPLRTVDGTVCGALVVLGLCENESEMPQYLARATAIRDELQAQIPSFAALFKTDSPFGLEPAATVVIPNSPGKFDFLAVDSTRNRLLASHEKDKTADFIDLDSHQILARLRIGPAVGMVVDPKTGNYFASVQDDKRVAVIDSATLKETASISMPAETDAIIFDAKDRRVYVTNDEGKFVWVIDADAQKLIASVSIPATPECLVHDAAADRVYLNLKDANQIAVIDTKTNAIVETWPSLPAMKIHGVAFDPVTKRLFSAGANGILVAIDVTTGKVVDSAKITPEVDQIAFDPVSRRIFCSGTNYMSVVQESDDGLQSLGEVKTAATAKNVAIDPAAHLVWTTYTDGKTSYAKSWIIR